MYTLLLQLANKDENKILQENTIYFDDLPSAQTVINSIHAAMQPEEETLGEGKVITPLPPDHAKQSASGIVTPKPPFQIAREQHERLKELSTPLDVPNESA